jgi:hypothetical protein
VSCARAGWKTPTTMAKTTSIGIKDRRESFISMDLPVYSESNTALNFDGIECLLSSKQKW